MIQAKINKIILFTLALLCVFYFTAINLSAQRYSIDKAPEKKLKMNIHLKGLFKKNDLKKKQRQKKKETRKNGRNEIRTFKKNWKKIDHPKELSSKRKVVKRMKKNLKITKRVNHNKHKEGVVKRLSRKKIKLPKISITKIRWPWTKKSSQE
jgi:hypothetical protein